MTSRTTTPDSRAPLPITSNEQSPDEARDAARYRWLRDQAHSLETRQRDKAILNGLSCYHVVGEIRELKWGDDLDAAIDAAIAEQDGKGGKRG